MIRSIRVLLALVLFCTGGARVEAQHSHVTHQVVIHASNPTTTMNHTDLSRVFLKKVTVWKNGERILPVDLAPRSAIRERFSRTIHHRSVRAIQAFWQKQLYSGREVPPPELESDADVLSYLRRHPNAIGYVSATTSLGSDLRRVVTVE